MRLMSQRFADAVVQVQRAPSFPHRAVLLHWLTCIRLALYTTFPPIEQTELNHSSRFVPA